MPETWTSLIWFGKGSIIAKLHLDSRLPPIETRYFPGHKNDVFLNRGFTFQCPAWKKSKLEERVLTTASLQPSSSVYATLVDVQQRDSWKNLRKEVLILYPSASHMVSMSYVGVRIASAEPALAQVFRQKDQSFVNILEAVRLDSTHLLALPSASTICCTQICQWLHAHDSLTNDNR